MEGMGSSSLWTRAKGGFSKVFPSEVAYSGDINENPDVPGLIVSL